MSVFIAAEAGVNHLGDRATMLQFCDVAKSVGADAVKFQAFDAVMLAKQRGFWELIEKAPAVYTEHKHYLETFKLLQRTQLSDDDLDAIAAHCKAIRFKWFASVFDPSQVERVLSRGACALKIGHGEAGCEELKDAAFDGLTHDSVRSGMIRKPLWISTHKGLAIPHARYVHCVSEYPADGKRPCLADIGGENYYTGFSSHYTDWRIPAAAALRRPRYIEAHLKLSDADPEAAWSLSVEDFTKMVKQIREYETWL